MQYRFHQKTWQAFWNSVVEQHSIETVSQQLQMSPGAIYVARSRVMNRIRLEANRILESEWEAGLDSESKNKVNCHE